MLTLTNQSFFIREINLPNVDKGAPKAELDLNIARYEPECLRTVLGDSLYLKYSSNVNYLVEKNVIGNVVKNDQVIKVSYTTGLKSGSNTFTFDGTKGTSDYRGFTIVPYEFNGLGLLQLGVDYSWDQATGIFTFLTAGKVFVLDKRYHIHFENTSFIFDGSGVVVNELILSLIYGCDYVNGYGENSYWEGLIREGNVSLMAYYIYWFHQSTNASKTTGVNTSVPKVEMSENFSPADKMINAWNTFSRMTQKLHSFLWNYKLNDIRYFPEFTYNQFSQSARATKTNNIFGL